MVSSSAKRIQRELAELTTDPPCNCSAGPKGDNVYEWVSSIVGPPGNHTDLLLLLILLYVYNPKTYVVLLLYYSLRIDFIKLTFI